MRLVPLCWGHHKGGPPTSSAAPHGHLAPTLASWPLHHAGCCSPSAWAEGWCRFSTFCTGIWGVWCITVRSEEGKTLGRIGCRLHCSGTTVLPCPCCCGTSLDGTSGPRKTDVQGTQGGEPQSKPMEKGQLCQLLAWPSPTSLNTCLQHPALPARVPKYSI